mmetsp:Transcript_65592/g.73183  ORF Transcript_65592/g.73183 Transcript_65592/m.73183 type:complete len:459 (-) Transcript_65592:454-1830(-)
MVRFRRQNTSYPPAIFSCYPLRDRFRFFLVSYAGLVLLMLMLTLFTSDSDTYTFNNTLLPSDYSSFLDSSHTYNKFADRNHDNSDHHYHHVPSTEAVEHTIRRHSRNYNNRTKMDGILAHTNMHTTTNISNTNLPYRVVPGNKIFVTSPLVAEDIIENNMRMIPTDFEIHIFDNSAMAKSVQIIDRQLSSSKNNLHGAWEAWSALRPWAYRADLWRLMILWSEGGVYLDSKMRLRAPLTDWATILPGREQLVLCRDTAMRAWQSTKLSNNKNNNNTINTRVPVLWTGAMAAPKESSVVLEAIRILVQNVQHRTYSLLGEEDALKDMSDFRTLAITGPVLIGYVASMEKFTTRTQDDADGNGNVNTVRVPCGFYHRKGGEIYRDPYSVNQDEEGLILKLDKDENKRVHDSSNVYRFLHKNRQVYCDDGDDKGSNNEVHGKGKNSKAVKNTPCDIASLLK